MLPCARKFSAIHEMLWPLNNSIGNENRGPPSEVRFYRRFFLETNQISQSTYENEIGGSRGLLLLK